MTPNQAVDSLSKLAGQNIRNRRKSKGITQKALAQMSDVASSHLCYVEKGQRGLTLACLGRLADSLDISAFELLKPTIALSVEKSRIFTEGGEYERQTLSRLRKDRRKEQRQTLSSL